MSLKFPFKFTHPSESFVFTAEKISDDMVNVTWCEDDGYIGNTSHTVATVETFVGVGVWTIIEEAEETNMTQSTYDEMFDRIELLESLLVDANTRIAELEEQSKDCLPKEFKPISQMTLEDWEQAKREHAVFVTNEGRETIIEDIEDSVIFLDFYVYGFTLDGRHGIDPDEYFIVKRIR